MADFPIAYMRYPSQSLSSPSSIDHREGQDRFQNEQTRRAAPLAVFFAACDRPPANCAYFMKRMVTL